MTRPPLHPTGPAVHACPALFALVAALLAAPGAGADDAAGPPCAQAEPCVLRVTLDDTVWFDAPDDHEATVRQHHWYVLDVLNAGDENRTLTLGDRTYPAPGADGDGPRSRHGPITFPEAGTLVLRDGTTGAQATVRVEPADPPQEPPPEEPEPGSDDPPAGEDDGAQEGDPPQRRKDVPAPLAAPLAALALVVALRRR